MPPQTGRNPLADKLNKKGLAKAFEEHKNDETDYGSGGGDLPAGLTGVAQLSKAEFGEYKSGDQKGEPYIILVGIITECSNSLYVGNRATKTLPLCDDPKKFANPKSFEENLAAALNELRKMGVDTKSMKGDYSQLEAALLGLAQEGPHFKFHTWAPNNPTTGQPGRVRIDFDGKIDGYVAGEGGGDDGNGGVEDNSEAGNEAGSDDAGQDWAALGTAADSGDIEAQQTLENKAKELGVDSEAAASWGEVATQIAEQSGGGSDDSEASEGSEGGDEEATPWKPEVGDVYLWKPKGKQKSVEVEITHVFKETLNMRTVKDKQVHKGIKWSANPDTLDDKPLETA